MDTGVYMLTSTGTHIAYGVFKARVLEFFGADEYRNLRFYSRPYDM